MPSNDNTLTELRRAIDAIDDKLFELIKQRTSTVEQVAVYKSANEALQSNIRPGREAEMIRRVYTYFAKEKFSAAAAADIWRSIIAASTSVETQMAISVYATDSQPLYYWLAREYFGPFMPIMKHPTVGRAIGEVLDRKANAVILPLPMAEEQNPWWLSLVENDRPELRIFAILPFVLDGRPGRDPGTALAVGRVTPEPTGKDKTYLCLTTDNNISIHRLQGAVAKIKLDAQWVSIHSSMLEQRRHLLLADGFLTDGDPILNAFRQEAGTSLLSIQSLGSYAVPIIQHELRSETR